MPIHRTATGQMKNVTVNKGIAIPGTHIDLAVDKQMVHRMTT